MTSGPRRSKVSGAPDAWEGGDLKATVDKNAGIGSDAGLPEDVRFARGIVNLVRSQIAEGTANRPCPAVFLLQPNARALDESVQPRRVPMLNNGKVPIAGRLWYVNEAVVSGKYLELEATDDDEIFSIVTDRLQLGTVTAAIVEHRTKTPAVRFYPRGLGEPDDMRVIPIAATVTLNQIFNAIDRIHEKSLLTPDANSVAGKLWKNATKCHPIKNAEDVVQMYLRIGLTMAFPTCDIRHEQPSAVGRLDLKIEESDALDKTDVKRHAILELKVLRSYSSSGKPLSAAQTGKWIESGVNQAHYYGKEWHAKGKALCCFDMRQEPTGEHCFSHVRKLAKDLQVELKLWFLFRSSERMRRATSNQTTSGAKE